MKSSQLPSIPTTFILSDVSGAIENGRVQTGLYLGGGGWGVPTPLHGCISSHEPTSRPEAGSQSTGLRVPWGFVLPPGRCQRQAVCEHQLTAEVSVVPRLPNTQLGTTHTWLWTGNLPRNSQTVGSERTFWKPLSLMYRCELLKVQGKKGQRQYSNPRPVTLA